MILADNLRYTEGHYATADQKVSQGQVQNQNAGPFSGQALVGADSNNDKSVTNDRE